MVVWIKSLIIVGSLAIVTLFKLYMNSYQDDNVFEEMVEEIIQIETGVDIDLTPMSSENNN